MALKQKEIRVGKLHTGRVGSSQLATRKRAIIKELPWSPSTITGYFSNY